MILSIAVLELSVTVSLNPLIEANMHCTKLLSKFVSSNILMLLFMFVTKFTFTKFICIILVYCRIISKSCVK